MDFDLTEEEAALRRSVHDFLMREAPRDKIRQWEDEGYYPAELMAKMAAAGWFGLPFPEQYGGANMDAVCFALLVEELARQDYELSECYGVTTYLAMNLMHNGTKEQKDYYIPRVIRGEQNLTVSMTEPDAGSDVGGIRASATAEGDCYVINGQKMFASGAALPNNTIFLLVRTDPTLSKHKGLTLFLLDPKAPGVEIRPIRTLGSRIYQTYALYLDNVRVPGKDIIGQLNGGWKVLMSTLEHERMYAAAAFTGLAQAAVEDAIQYAKERVQFGQPIGKFQAIAHMLADMQTEVDAARLLAYRCAFLVKEGRRAIIEVSMAKLYCSEVAARVTNQGMQILGGYGYTMEADMQRYFRTARILTVAGGSSQIQRDIIAKQLGL